MDLGIKGKYALVTGGSRGIGRSIALALAEEGCNVAICARDGRDVEKTVSELKTRNIQSIGVQADVTISANIERVVKTILDSWGTIHILVNNVGGGGRWGNANFTETPEEIWLKVYSLNALAAIRFTMKAIPFMKSQRWGRVVTIVSTQGLEGGGRPWYNMAKSAEISLMKTLAMDPDLSRYNITFNSIAPGATIFSGNEWDTLRKDNPTELKRIIEWKHPLGRLGTPEEVASAVVFLCSEKASLVNGVSFAVDGGESKRF